MRLPGRTPSGKKKTAAPPSSVSAARIMPSETYLPPIIGRGARFATMPTFLPVRSSGAYHLAMPERMVRSRSPSKTDSLSSFLLSFMRSQDTTCPTSISTLLKAS